MSIQEHDLDPVEPPAPSPLMDILIERRATAASGLRDVQAWAAAYASMLESGASSLDDVLLAERAYHASLKRAGEALHCLGVSIACEGVA